MGLFGSVNDKQAPKATAGTKPAVTFADGEETASATLRDGSTSIMVSTNPVLGVTLVIDRDAVGHERAKFDTYRMHILSQGGAETFSAFLVNKGSKTEAPVDLTNAQQMRLLTDIVRPARDQILSRGRPLTRSEMEPLVRQVLTLTRQ